MSFSLRPRFMPDREVHKEWGRLGSISAKLIRKGLRVPPTAAFGYTQVEEWFRGFRTYSRAIEDWRIWENVDTSLDSIRQEILSAPMPDHWPKSCATTQQLLCGGETWQITFRPTLKRPQHEPASFKSFNAKSDDPLLMWKAFCESVAQVFTEAHAQEILQSGLDPIFLKLSIVIRPEIIEDPQTAIFPAAAEKRAKASRVASKLLKRPARITTIWDGEELWILDAQVSTPLKNIEPRVVKYLLVDLDGTLLGARQFPLQVKFLGTLMREMKKHGGWIKAFRALRLMNSELTKPSSTRMNSERAAERFAEATGQPIEGAQDILRETVSKLFPKLEKYFFPVPGAKDFLDWAKERFPMILATNPVWDIEIISLRLKWAGIDPAIFKSITHNTRMRATKPSADYYLDLLRQEGLHPDECLLIGDHWLNDLSAVNVGIPVFILSNRFSLRAIDSRKRPAPAWQGSYPMLRSLLKIMGPQKNAKENFQSAKI